MGTQKIHYELVNSIARLRMDDGKANSIETTFLRELHAGLDRAEAEAKALVVEGRPGFFSAGLDLKVVPTLNSDQLREFLAEYLKAMFRLWRHPAPVVAAVSGHMVAGGAILGLCCDRRWGAAGDYHIGMNEVAIGIPLPVFAWEIASQVLAPSARMEALLFGEVYDPQRALSVGYLDRLVPAGELSGAAREEAARLAALPAQAVALTKQSIRGPLAGHAEPQIEQLVEAFFRGGPFSLRK